jgi:hypothetical protein
MFHGINLITVFLSPIGSPWFSDEANGNWLSGLCTVRSQKSEFFITSIVGTSIPLAYSYQNVRN